MQKRILVVDDETDIRDILKAFFEGFGYEVLTASSGEEALGLLKETDAPVMFLDMNMPGMDGLELCRRIRKTNGRSAIFALTGYHRLFTPEASDEAGFDGYFKKPVNLHLLHNAALRGFEKAGITTLPQS